MLQILNKLNLNYHLTNTLKTMCTVGDVFLVLSEDVN